MVVQPKRARLHAIVDALPEAELDEFGQLLESFATADPALRTALLAPIDDEPLSEAQIASIERSKQQVAQGNFVNDDDLDEYLVSATD